MSTSSVVVFPVEHAAIVIDPSLPSARQAFISAFNTT
jgi:hypothetical protein